MQQNISVKLLSKRLTRNNYCRANEPRPAFFGRTLKEDRTVLDHSFLQTQIYIAVIAEEGSFSRAARRLHTAQSFLTRSVSE